MMKRIRKHCDNETSNSTCVETSNKKFGKVHIVLQSYNRVPQIKAFYEKIPDILPKKQMCSF